MLSSICDAPRHIPLLHNTRPYGLPMHYGGAQPGRKLKHAAGRPKVIMQARVNPESRERIRQIADACGASSSFVVEMMVVHQPLDDQGRPIWWETALAATSSSEQDEGQLPMSA